MRGSFAWAEWDVLRRLTLLLFILQVFVLGFLSVVAAERLLLSREPVFLELRLGHTVSTAQELFVFLQRFPPVLRVTYRTREQQFLASQAMFPDAHFSERGISFFQDGLLVRVRTPQGYRSLLGVLMAEQRWQGLLSPSTLVRIGEQAHKMQSIGIAFRFLQVCFLVAIFTLSCLLFFALLRRARQAYSVDGEHGVLQEYLGVRSFSIIGPVAYRLTVVVFCGILLSFLVILSAVMLERMHSTIFVTVLLPMLHRVWWFVLLAEGVVAALLSVSGAILCRHVLRIPLRHAHSQDY